HVAEWSRWRKLNPSSPLRRFPEHSAILPPTLVPPLPLAASSSPALSLPLPPFRRHFKAHASGSDGPTTSDHPFLPQQIQGASDGGGRLLDIRLGVRCGRHAAQARQIDALQQHPLAEGVDQLAILRAVHFLDIAAVGNEIVAGGTRALVSRNQ